MGNNKNKRYFRKRQFKGNKFCKRVSVFSNEKISINSSIPTASDSKVIDSLKPADVPENNEKNFIFNLGVHYNIISLLCCPECFERKVSVVQDSVFGLALSMTLICENCDYSFPFCTLEKVNQLHSMNLALGFGMRIIGDEDSKGYASVKDIYSKNTVAKYEYIRRIQNRVRTKLRKLKSKQKDLGGRGKLTDVYR
ncbi:hypothetical protein TNCV_3109651 [Trichonephila clavipes]|nr:hypothetical protein TNCV_3109651 [Trichonephila clavipes]